VARRAFAAPAAEWFEVSQIEPRVWLIAEPGHVCSWLIAGDERSLLLDTGLGIADIATAIAPIVDEPPVVVNSHVHFDHVGGNELFDHSEMHECAPHWVSAGCDPAILSEYARLAVSMKPSWDRLLAADREGWFLIGPEEEVRPWPEARVAELGWRIDPPAPARVLADGDLIDLGGRTVRVLHTPGHAPDHICLLDEAHGILFAQDQAYYGPHLLYLPGSDVAAFAQSARRLADDVAGEVRVVYAAHCLRPSVPPRFLVQLARGAESVAAGEAAVKPATGMLGEPVLGADFGHFSILIDPSKEP
jgi:glyoxylase-like metal-dependent hydrolase (beta-lactamase superfamily II)